MNLGAPTLLPSATGLSPLARGAGAAAQTDAQRTFESVLGRASARLAPGASTEDLGRAARDAAENLIAVALVQPMLSMARTAYDPAPPFQKTQADEQFGALMDATTALDIVRSSDWAVVDRLAQDLLRGVAARAPGDPPGGGG